MSKIAEKIAKIIAKADSTTSETEAETFMTKAHALMEQHGLSLLDIGKLDSDDPIGVTENTYVSSDGWKDTIAGQLARYYGAELARCPHGRASRSYTVAGRESARITFQLMLPFVIKQVARIALQEWKAGNYPTRTKAQAAIANAMGIRLYRLRQEQKADAVAKHGAARQNALVPVDLVQEALEEHFGGNLRTARSKSWNTDSNAMHKAEQVSLHRQTAAHKGAKRIGAG